MKSLKERVDIELAYLEGKSIQYCLSDGSWRDCIGEPSFQWHANEYRVKPEEPTTMYRAVYLDSYNIVCVSQTLFKLDEVEKACDKYFRFLHFDLDHPVRVTL
jgi:hypothetical protein